MKRKIPYGLIIATIVALVCWYDWRIGIEVAALLAAAAVLLRQELADRTRARNDTAAANTELRERIDELQQRSRELTMLTEMSELLQLSTTLAEANEILPPFALRLFPSYDGALYVAGSGDRELELAASWGAATDVSAFAATDCWAVRRAHAHSARGDSGGVACRHTATQRGATLCIPMLASGDAIGVLSLHAPDLVTVDPDVELFAKAFGDQIALSLANLRLQDTLRMRAVRDALTGLFNRGHMHEALTRELLRATRETSRPGVILADVDNFKHFNDTWGHPGGDALLQQLGRLMQRIFRAEDVVCRYGGEEFLIVLPDASLDLLESSAARLRDECRQLSVRLKGELLGAITISAGYALYPRHGMTVEELIAGADRALYTAKSTGRDRVCAPSHPVLEIDAA
jgi:diguanylate cyclase (GGDEF)-like protein